MKVNRILVIILLICLSITYSYSSNLPIQGEITSIERRQVTKASDCSNYTENMYTVHLDSGYFYDIPENLWKDCGPFRVGEKIKISYNTEESHWYLEYILIEKIT